MGKDTNPYNEVEEDNATTNVNDDASALENTDETEVHVDQDKGNQDDDDPDLVDDKNDDDGEGDDIDVLSLSDEDFLKINPEDVKILESKSEDNSESDDLGDGDDNPSLDQDLGDNKDLSEKDVFKKDSDSKESKKNKEDGKSKTAEKVDGIDYKAEYEKLMAPFRANQQDMSVKNVDDAITLMQKGANYYQKMRDIKPKMKILKMLDNADLLDIDKLNYIIDIHKKNPAAIQKLVKESGVNPLDINVTEEDDTYVPPDNTVSDKEIELDSVLDDIEHTESFNKTLDVITKVWDDASCDIVSNRPDLIGPLNEHIANGTYDKVMKEVIYAKTLGHFKDVSDIQAYYQVGEHMYKQGQLNPSDSKKNLPPKTNSPVKKQKDKKRSVNKRAATHTNQKTVNPGKKKRDFNLLSLPDDEFDKINIDDYN